MIIITNDNHHQHRHHLIIIISVQPVNATSFSNNKHQSTTQSCKDWFHFFSSVSLNSKMTLNTWKDRFQSTSVSMAFLLTWIASMALSCGLETICFIYWKEKITGVWMSMTLYTELQLVTQGRFLIRGLECQMTSMEWWRGLILSLTSLKVSCSLIKRLLRSFRCP